MTEIHSPSLPDSVRLPFEAQNHGVTPYFKVITPLNVAQSQEAGKPIYGSPMEVVDLRFAGDRNYAPVVPVDSMYRKVGTRTITYAEQFSDQYRAFMTGGDQVAGGTALEALSDYGITPSQLSVCRALKIYSVEALHTLDGPNVKSLGMNANSLKAMAARYMEDQTRRDTDKNATSIEAMQAEINRLKALIPDTTPAPEEVDAIVAAADADQPEYADAEPASDSEKIDLKDRIEKVSGSRPRGNPSISTLRDMLSELEG